MAGKGRQDGGNGPRKPKPAAGRIKDAEVVRQVDALVAPLLAADGLEMVLVEYRREAGGRVLRLYIDKPGGISLDDCVSVSREISDLLDVSLDNIGPYRLEVSSPGADRPLVKPEHFEQFIDERVQVRLKAPVAGRKNIRGRLSETTADGIAVETDTGTFQIRFDEIATARLISDLKP
jgi:ribosome maturation factor RimP